jgi:hypothetical protein
MLHRPDGATIAQMTKAMGWQPQSVRSQLHGVLKRRLGLSIVSEKGKRGRVYRIPT